VLLKLVELLLSFNSIHHGYNNSLLFVVFFFCLYDLVLCVHDWRKVVWIYMVSVGIAMGINIS